MQVTTYDALTERLGSMLDGINSSDVRRSIKWTGTVGNIGNIRFTLASGGR